MEHIGRYNSIDCIKCSQVEYFQMYEEGTLNSKNIYIIDGNMVLSNKVIGFYNGREVLPDNSGKTYMEPKKRREYNKEIEMLKERAAAEAKKKMEQKTESVEWNQRVLEMELNIPNIKYSDYSKVVDEFFKRLEV